MSATTGTVSCRRGADRIQLRCPVIVEAPGLAAVRGQLVSLSAAGMSVVLPCEIPLGVEVQVVVQLPDECPPLRVAAMGVHQDRGPSGAPPVKVGLHLIQPPAPAVERLRALIFSR